MINTGGDAVTRIARLSTDELVAAFRRYQVRRGLTAATQVAYAQYVARLTDWMAGRAFEDLRASDIELVYLVWWSDQFEERFDRPPAKRTVRNHLIALNALFEFLTRYGYVPANPIRAIERPRITYRRNDRLTAREMAALLSACQTPAERVLIPLLLWTGMRGGEATSLLKRDVDLDERTIRVRRSKTPTGLRMIPVLPPLVGPLQVWLSYQHSIGLDHPDSPLVSTRRGRALRHAQIWTIVKRVAHRAGVRPRVATDHNRRNLSDVSPHTLRRTFGSELLNRGVRLEVVAKLLGHANTTTTERCYAELLNATAVNEALRAFLESDGFPLSQSSGER